MEQGHALRGQRFYIDRQKICRVQNRDVFVAAKIEQMPIAGNNVVYGDRDCAGQDVIVIRIGTNHSSGVIGINYFGKSGVAVEQGLNIAILGNPCRKFVCD